MATEFIMPKLGLTMEEGTIAEWLADDGDMVDAGVAVLRIETDKTETDVEANGSGRLHVVAEVGDTYACGERIGWFLAEGEEPPTTGAGLATTSAAPAAVATAQAAEAAEATSPVAGVRLKASPLAKRLAREQGIDIARVRGTGPDDRIVAADLAGVEPDTAAAVARAATPAVVAPRALTPQRAQSGAPATAAARQLADLLGVDLASVPADAIDGRISREGVARHVRSLLAGLASSESAADESTSASSLPPTAALAPAMQTPSSVVKMSGMRGTIAKRMFGSLQEMAQLTLHMDADLDAVVEDRAQRKAAGSAPSYTDYVIAAVARALVEHPVVNSQITDDGLALLPAVHVGMAVALDKGLVVPVITDTAGRDLGSLGIETARLAAAAREGALSLDELHGGTFSVSTLGMFGVDGFTPVINPPNTAILGVGRLRDDLVMVGGEVSTVKRLTLSLTWDHRAFDGAPAAEFCQSIVASLADPATLDRPAAASGSSSAVAADAATAWSLAQR